MTDYNMWFWHNVRNDWMGHMWNNPIYDPLFRESGLTNDTDFLTMMQTFFKEHGIHRKVAFGAVDANDGSFNVFTEHHEPYEEIPRTVLGSCSLPPGLPAQPL